MLEYQEKDRISWDELLVHPIMNNKTNQNIEEEKV